jgi:regulator of sigma E protease
MIAILVFILILSILIIVHELGHFLLAKRIGVRVEKFSLGFGPQLFKRKKNHTEYCVSAIPLGGFVKLAGDSLEEYKGRSWEYFSKPPGKRFQVIFFGPLLNYFLGFCFFWLIFFIGYPTLTTKIGGLLDGFGAKEAGLQIGDKIIAVDGKKVDFWEELQQIIQSKKESNNVGITFLREGKEFSLEVRIREKRLEDQIGQKSNVGLIGITPFDEVVKIRHGFAHAFVLGLNKTLDLTILTYKG